MSQKTSSIIAIVALILAIVVGVHAKKSVASLEKRVDDLQFTWTESMKVVDNLTKQLEELKGLGASSDSQ